MARSRRPGSKKLASQLKALGALSPAELAEEEARHSVPHLARHRFVRRAWSFAVDESDTRWIDQAIDFAESQPDEPGAQAGAALKSMREKGVSDREIIALVRVMQHHMLHGVCFLLDHPNDVEPAGPSGAGAADSGGDKWALCALDAEGYPVQQMAALYELTADLDPTGRALRPPKKKSRKKANVRS
jgi:hypothetical protein